MVPCTLTKAFMSFNNYYEKVKLQKNIGGFGLGGVGDGESFKR